MVVVKTLANLDFYILPLYYAVKDGIIKNMKKTFKVDSIKGESEDYKKALALVLGVYYVYNLHQLEKLHIKTFDELKSIFSYREIESCLDNLGLDFEDILNAIPVLEERCGVNFVGIQVSHEVQGVSNAPCLCQGITNCNSIGIIETIPQSELTSLLENNCQFIFKENDEICQS